MVGSIFRKGKCMVVAEISANHGQNLDKAVMMIKEASSCGADAVKFQAYTPDTLTIDSDSEYFKVKHPAWKGQTLYQLYQKAFTPWEWFPMLKRIADKEGLFFFSTVFDESSVDALERFDVPVYKIASFELVDLPLIEYTARTGKPLILSTGMATQKEIDQAVKAARKNGAREIILLKCISDYPARPEEINLRTIQNMTEKYGCMTGLSDHTLGIGVSIAAVTLGAVMVEKHFILSRKEKTPDSFFSIEPSELKSLVENVDIVSKALGRVHYGPSEGEKKNLVFRRSIFAVKNIEKGEVFTKDNIRSIRPALGLKPAHMQKVLGKKAKKDILSGTPLSRGMF